MIWGEVAELLYALLELVAELLPSGGRGTRPRGPAEAERPSSRRRHHRGPVAPPAADPPAT